MPIPTRSQCLNLMEQIGMPVHIQRHSLLVAKVAFCLGSLLNETALALNLELIEAGALLHDIAKERSIRTGERHDDLGARMVLELGYHRLAPIIKDHVHLDRSQLEAPITESLLVNYSDKRVKHDRVVSLHDRFQDLIVRYAKTRDHRSRLLEKLDLFLEVEIRIFEKLTIGPADLEQLTGPGAENTWEDYETEDEGSSIVRRQLC